MVLLHSGTADRTATPGAVISGLIRWLPSIVTGPRLLNPANAPVVELIAPTV
jgi:hypothetical protein